MSRRSKRTIPVSDDDEIEEALPAKRGRVASPNESEEEANGTMKRRALNKGKGRAVDVEEEDDAEMEEDGDDDDAQAEEDEEDDEVNGSENVQTDLFLPELERGDDGYVVGSVTRIKLKNFMTYDFVEFRPGPRLNMILGPNGTGKSSIAAAIAIGLGFPPNVMGRAPNLQAYVKQGTDQSETEIELKAPRGKRNYVVLRRFQTGNEKSVWQLNGQTVTKREIETLVAQLGVQANNLCSFLPQDKVAEFAKMNPIDVLRETMRSAGDSRLSKWHGLLSEYGKEAKTIDGALNTAINQRDNLQVQVNELEPDVRNHTRRQDLEQELNTLRLLLFSARSRHAKDQLNSYREEVQKQRNAYNANQAKLEPLRTLQRDQEERRDAQKRKVHNLSVKIANHEQAIMKATDRSQRAAAEGSQLQAEIDQINTKKKKRAAKLRVLQERIQELEQRLAEPEENLLDELKAKKAEITEKTTVLRQLQREREQLDARLRNTEDDAAEYRKEIDNRNKRKLDLGSAEVQRRNQAFRFDPSIQYAVEWIEKNAMQFEAQVHYPPMMSVNVPDRRYAWQVEACTNVSQRKTFICQNQGDYRKLMSLNKRNVRVGDRMVRIGLHIATIDVNDETANPQRPCTPEKLAELGFDGFAIDFVEAAAPVHAYLCQVARLHRCAITTKESSAIDQDAVIAAGISGWHTRNDSNRASRSAYGKRESLVIVTAPSPARAFNISVDTEAVKTIEEEVADFKRKLKELEQPMGKLKAELQRVTASVSDAEKAHKTATAEQKQMQERQTRRQKAHLDLEAQRANLSRLEAEPDPEDARDDLKEQLLHHIKERRAQIQLLSKACEDAVGAVSTYSNSAMGKAQYDANINEIKVVKNASSEASDRVREEIQTLVPNVEKWKNIYNNSMSRLQDIVGSQPPEVQQLFYERNEPAPPGVEETKNGIAMVTAQLEASVGVSADTVQRHKRLSEQLNDRKATVNSLQKDTSKLRTKINKILAVFNPALEALVEHASVKFSEAFARVKCSGQLEVDREGDYANWGIKILVAFRDGEAFETLKMHRHSGGERSLATVTYLMSLSSMSRTPFSLVDEINQGMDARAERNVHDSMVGVTCADNVGQYFLITPKLLTGLDYHKNMKILIINNGPWIPEGANHTLSYGSFGQCLAKYKRHHAIAA